MGKVVEFGKAQRNENMEGEKIMIKANYYVIGELDGKGVKVPFDGTVFTDCCECGKAIDQDIHDIINAEDVNANFTEFGARICHECLQKGKLSKEQEKAKMTIPTIMNMVENELESVAENNKEVLLYFLGEVLGMKNQDSIAMCLERASGYIDALYDNGLMDDAEHGVLSMAIEAVQNQGGC